MYASLESHNNVGPPKIDSIIMPSESLLLHNLSASISYPTSKGAVCFGLAFCGGAKGMGGGGDGGWSGWDGVDGVEGRGWWRGVGGGGWGGEGGVRGGGVAVDDGCCSRLAYKL